jgi:subtilisin-like proprotein convertase family protein
VVTHQGIVSQPFVAPPTTPTILGNLSNPSVAVDPLNSQKIVAFFLDNYPTNKATPSQTMFTLGEYSTNGGVKFKGVSGYDPYNSMYAAVNLDDPTSSITAPVPFTEALYPSVAFDRQENFYVTFLETNASGSGGALVLQKFNFSGGAPLQVTKDQILDEWAAGSAAAVDRLVNPVIAIDNNLPSFTDPATGQTQTDPHAGTIYVSYGTINVPPMTAAPDPTFNPNKIEVIASSDNGVTFSPQKDFNATGTFPNNPGKERDALPQLAVSQGSLDGRIGGGQLTGVWNDFGNNLISYGVIPNGGGGGDSLPGSGTIEDAAPPIGGKTTPVTSFSTTTVSLDPTASITDLDVTLSIQTSNLSDLQVVLIAPDGTSVTLFENQVDEFGMTHAGVGITGSNLGIFNGPDAANLATTFDQEAPRAINDKSAAAPFIGHFTPDPSAPNGDLSVFYEPGTKGKSLNGTWTMQITDFHNDGTTQFQSYNWQLHFTEGLTVTNFGAIPTISPLTDPVGAGEAIAGGLGPSFPTNKDNAAPLGFGPAPVIAVDNTLGSLSPYQGRIYVAYVGVGLNADKLNVPMQFLQPDDTDIWLVHSDNGVNWSTPERVNQDFATDGFSEGNRPQFMPTLAVDQSTGTLVATWFDTRNDPAKARVATYVSVSIDGSASFSGETFVNTPQTALDASNPDGPTTVLGPTPDNFSTLNAMVDATNSFGTSQALIVNDGLAVPIWTGTYLNAGPSVINSAQVRFEAGPAVVDSTMGPVQAQTLTLTNPSRTVTINNVFTTDGIQELTGFTVTFDRPVDPSSFTLDQVSVMYRDTVTPSDLPGTPVAVASVTPIDLGTFHHSQGNLATQFLVTLVTPQSGTGTYSYSVGPNVRDGIRSTTRSTSSLGNPMDEDASGTAGQATDAYGAPYPLDGIPFQAPYFSETLPIVLPGPHVVDTAVMGAQARGGTSLTNNLVLNGTVSSIDVKFDRDMQASSFTPDQVLRIVGPANLIAGPYTVTPNPDNTDPNPNFPRTFRIGFPTQELSGTYTVVLGPNIKAKNGDAMDANLNAGVDVLRNTAPLGGTNVTVTTNAGNLPQTIAPLQTLQAPLTVNSNFVIQGITVTLDITDPNDQDLQAELISPNGTTIKLFTKVGGFGANFTNTTFDDNAGTPIQLGIAPFTGSFNPQLPLSILKNTAANGTYQLVITNNSSSNVAVLNSWSLNLLKATSGTGLGEPVADQTTVSFRIFTMNPTSQLAHNVWTAVGPASIGGGAAGRMTGLAMDPSDPSGNTVYVGGASGGIWKSTNFLTTDGAGPTYIPLTDFGPTFGINTGGIAVVGRNGDPNQSIVFAATGEGDTGTSGAGILRSLDGGVHWLLMDSTTNVDAAGNPLPIDSPLRDHKFVGQSAFTIIADPKLSPSGKAIAYVALVGGNGGVYGTQDGGDHWTLLRGGQATSVIFANDSADPTTGNLQLLYAGFRGDGVYMSPNQGSSWTQMTGTVGYALLQNANTGHAVHVNGPVDTPNGPKGRIALVAPALTGDPLTDKILEGWLYAAVVTSGGAPAGEGGVGGDLDGLYLTKDFGQNWVKINLPEREGSDGLYGVPSNNNTIQYTDPLGNKIGPNPQSQGNYDLSLAIDPLNPNITYIGGTQDFGPGLPLFFSGASIAGVIRVDATGTLDAHALVGANYHLNDGGATGIGTGPGITNLATPTGIPANLVVTQTSNYINVTRDPGNPFLVDATITADGLDLGDKSTITNSGNDPTGWIPFNTIPGGSTDQHRVYTMIDPLTGRTRIVFADDQGIFTGVDRGDGSISAGIGSAPSTFGSLDGNLQVTQFYYGAAQPSNVAASIAGAMFYGSAQDDGIPASDPNVLTDGNISWGGPGGDSSAVATDPAGTGAAYHYMWPCCGGNGTDFFQVTNPGSGTVGRTVGLLQAQNPGATPDPQWPYTGGFRFAVNPYVSGAVDPTTGASAQEIIMGSGAGRVFRTNDQGVTWFSIGEPSALDMSVANALTFGAPDPGANGSADNFIYIGTTNGNIFVTFTGGSPWTKLSGGLDGSSVQAIVANPAPGSHEVFAVTSGHVYHMADSSAPGATWQDITGNLFTITHSIFGRSDQSETQLRGLSALAVDWRPELSAPSGGVLPTVYVGGDSGVYRSTDGGSSWTIFPSVAADGSPQDGGFLPNAHISNLQLVLGNINSTTGLPDQAGGPNLLVANTYGRGTFAIRLPNNQAPGPHVVSFNPTNVSGSISSVTVTFANSVDPASFTNAVITTFRGPNGPITPTAITPQNNTDTIFQITFPTQSTPGLYTLTFGPNLTDFAGDLMDQNQNGVNGEAVGDDYTGHFVIGAPNLGHFIVTGAGFGGGPEVRVVDVSTGLAKFDFFAYDPNFHGGVRVATGDVNGDGTPDIITGPGPGGGPEVKVFDGVTGAVIRDFMAFDPNFNGGVFVASGDVNGDGFSDILVGADAGGGPEVRVYSGKDGSVLYSFFAYDPNFHGGVRVAAGDTNGDGYADIVTAAGAGGGPEVRVYSGKDGSVMQSYFAYDPNFSGGVYVAAGDVRGDAGDTNGDGKADIVVGAGPGGGPEVRVFSGADGTALQGFFPYDPNFHGGVRVSLVGDLNNDGLADLVTGAGIGGGPHVQVLDGVTLSSLDSFFAYDPNFHGGVWVGSI